MFQQEGRRGRSIPGGAPVFAIAFAALLLLAQGTTVVRPPWQPQTPALPVTRITVGSTPLGVELATTPATRARGLGYRAGLLPGTGMLFVVDQPQPQSFWMKGMRFCLDIVWIERGQIVGAAENACPAPAGTPDSALPTYLSPEPVRYVLEVPAGWLRANGYGAGTPVEIPPLTVAA